MLKRERSERLTSEFTRRREGGKFASNQTWVEVGFDAFVVQFY